MKKICKNCHAINTAEAPKCHLCGEGFHRRMEYTTTSGNTATITGDPNMPPETMAALQEMIRLAEIAAMDGDLDSQNVSRQESTAGEGQP